MGIVVVRVLELYMEIPFAVVSGYMGGTHSLPWKWLRDAQKGHFLIVFARTVLIALTET